MMQPNTILCGDSQAVLRTLPDNYFSCCITSPPYWDTRYSGFADRLGYEEDYRDYIQALVQVFREVRRTLTPAGTLWLVIGDTYAGDDPRWWAMCEGKPEKELKYPRSLPEGFKNKDLMGIPWRLAMSLQIDGWYLRSDIIWSVSNTCPEPVGIVPPGAMIMFFFLQSRNSMPTMDATGKLQHELLSGRFRTGIILLSIMQYSPSHWSHDACRPDPWKTM